MIIDPNFSSLSVYADFFVDQLWTDPVASLIQPGQSALPDDLYCESSGFAAAGNIDGDNLFRGLSVGYSSLVMPPQATVMFRVACSLDSYYDGGEVHCLFRDDGREVMCPGVWIDILS